MKLIAPENLSGPVSHRGCSFEIPADRSLDVPDCEAEHFTTHGFRPLGEEGVDQDRLRLMSREALVAHALELTSETVRGLSTEDLRARLRAIKGVDPRLPPETEGAGVSMDASAIAHADVERMNRHELFAFLRARGAPAPAVVRNEELRARARSLVSPDVESH